MSSAKIKKIVKSTYDKESAIYDETRAFYESGYGGDARKKNDKQIH